MKYSKRYIAFTGVLAVALLIKFNNFGEQYQTVNRFRGAQLEETTWNPLIAQSVNDGLLSVVIDNKEYTNEKYPFFMDANLDIMVPVSILRDALNCSAHIYNEDTLLVEKHNSELSFSLNDDMIDKKLIYNQANFYFFHYESLGLLIRTGQFIDQLIQEDYFHHFRVDYLPTSSLSAYNLR